MPSITSIPGNIVRASLQGLRLPLTAVEAVTRPDDTLSWPPALAFDSFEAGAKQVFGSLLRDDELVREGRLQQAKVQEATKAARLEAEAEQTHQQGDADLVQRRDHLTDARDQQEQRAQQRRQQIEQERAERERKIRQETAARQQAVAKSTQLREKAVTAQEREARRTRVREESAALQKKSAALTAARRADTLGNAAAARKAQRKTS